MSYKINEGTLRLPAGFQDRTINVFVPGDTAPFPFSLTVSRDTKPSDEALDDYVDRQVELIAAKLAKYKPLDRKLAQLSMNVPIQGIQIDSRYKASGKDVYQRQAAFPMAPERVLVFTASGQAPFTSEQDALWVELLSNFIPSR
ncbi:MULTISPECIES: DcrB-related protein [Pseudomonas]|uniref:DcrB-related protein n=1 Tax=Pseudomonas TaxID=286 RepID=UPI000EFA601E|nr:MULTISPECIES: DUF1795 domain-containing protein [Pseudomonas]AYN96132.1 DUF1795 domain-containing protein [Pseudomonas sp. LTJR-52]RRW41214.1 DUF1795 domain-containing protein [Pseudomonas luteola]